MSPHLKIIAIVFILSVGNIFSQTPSVRFQHLSVDQGLSQSSVTAILQDSNGFMWFGTQDGLNKYDGYGFTIYRHNPFDSTSLASNFVFSLCEDTSRTIWINMENGGLDCFNPYTETFHHYQDKLNQATGSPTFVRCLYRSRDGTIWLGSNIGLHRVLLESKGFVHYAIDSSESKDTAVSAILEDSDGVLWIATTTGRLYTFDHKKHTFDLVKIEFKNASELQVNFIASIYEDSDKNLWLGTFPTGLVQFDRTARTFRSFNNQRDGTGNWSRNGVGDIVEDSRGNLWVGTETAGLNLFHKNDLTLTRYTHNPLQNGSLSSNIILSLFADKAGTLWVGTAGGGINKYDPHKEKFLHFKNDPRHPQALQGNMVWALCEDSAGDLWIGMQNGGLNRYDRSKDEYRVFLHDSNDPYSVSHNTIYSIYEDRSGVLWVGTNGGGLNRFDRTKQSFKRYVWQPTKPNSLNSNSIKTIYEDRDGNLWLGTLGGGLNRFDRETEQFEHYVHEPENPNSLSANMITSIVEDKAGNLWLGTINGGINRFDKEKGVFERYLHDPGNRNSLSNDYVMSICQDASGILWIGTFYGLNRFDPATNRFKLYSSKNGLPNDVIYGVLCDDQGSVWCSSNRGISKFDPKTEIFKNYGLDDGLQSNEFNSGACFKNKKGELFFGGINGFNAFHPQQVTDNPNIPPVVITGFKKFDQTVGFSRAISDLDKIQLSYNDDFITFEFTALNYTNPEKNQYAYKLEGFNENWIRCGGQRYATFTNLDPGEYVFRVRGSNNDGVWNEKGAQVRLIVTPPFWETWWFLGLMTVLAMASLALFIFRLKLKEKKKAELNRKISELKLQALRAQMNPHFIFNTINSIQYYISSKEPKAAYAYLSKFARLMRKILENSEKSTVPLAEELEALKLYLELETLRFEGKFCYRLEIDRTIDIHNLEIPTMLIQPFVENAIHHGLRHKKRKGFLKINLKQNGAAIICIIEDNGIGISKSLQLKQKQNDGHKPTGMKITEERLATLNALKRNGRGVEIIDLSKNNGNQGTLVKIVIPIEE